MQTYDLFAPATMAERHALFAKMRGEPGLCRVELFGAYAAARYEDAAAILKDPQRFSSEALAVTAEPAWLGPNPVAHSMLSMDPPRHTSSARTPEQHEEIRCVVREMRDYLTEVIQERRRRPGEDMVSDLLRAEVEGQKLTDEQLLSFLFLLLPAGMETTTQLLGNAVLTLAQHPEHLELMRADRAHIARFIEEVLRYESPTQLSFRMAMQDVIQWIPGFTMHGPAVLPVELVAAG